MSWSGPVGQDPLGDLESGRAPASGCRAARRSGRAAARTASSSSSASARRRLAGDPDARALEHHAGEEPHVRRRRRRRGSSPARVHLIATSIISRGSFDQRSRRSRRPGARTTKRGGAARCATRTRPGRDAPRRSCRAMYSPRPVPATALSLPADELVEDPVGGLADRPRRRGRRRRPGRGQRDRRRLGRDLDRLGRRRVLPRVLEQVAEHLLQPVGVAVDEHGAARAVVADRVGRVGVAPRRRPRRAARRATSRCAKW